MPKGQESGGIYIFKYKYDPLVYYIGRTSSFAARFKSHMVYKRLDKFHVFANLVGWENFQVSIVEICKISELGSRENYYLQKYLPLLNTAFNSKYTEGVIFKNLTRFLASKRKEPIKTNQGIKTSIWVYELSTTQIEQTYVQYDSINKASLGTGRSRDTIQRYLDTNVPIKGALFYTSPIVDYRSTFKLAITHLEELSINDNSPKKVWVYTIKNGRVILVNNKPFPSRRDAVEFLNTSASLVNSYLDSSNPKDLKGYYLFNNPLDSDQLNSLPELSKKLKTLTRSNLKSVWVYDAETMELINGTPFPSINKCTEYFKVDSRSIVNNMDTKLAVVKKGLIIYFFSNEISKELKHKLLGGLHLAPRVVTKIWVYKVLDGEYTLYDNNQPFSSKLQVYKQLAVASDTVSRYLDTHKGYKGLFFFSSKVTKDGDT